MNNPLNTGYWTDFVGLLRNQFVPVLRDLVRELKRRNDSELGLDYLYTVVTTQFPEFYKDVEAAKTKTQGVQRALANARWAIDGRSRDLNPWERRVNDEVFEVLECKKCDSVFMARKSDHDDGATLWLYCPQCSERVKIHRVDDKENDDAS